MATRNFSEDFKQINPKLQKYFFNAGNPLVTASSYAGELALPYLSAAVKSGVTLANNWVTIKENVPFKAVLKNVSDDGLIQAGACDWNDDGVVTLTERVLQPTELMVNTELCKGNFRDDWEAQATGSLYDDRIPPTFEEFLLSYVAEKVAESVENSIWNGTAGSGSFQGFATASTGLIPASGTTVSLTGSAAGGIDQSTVIHVFNQMIEGVTTNAPAMLNKEDLTIYVSPKTSIFYQRYLANAGYVNEYYVNEKPMNYLGYPIAVCGGMPDDACVIARKSNLYFGTNLMTDMTNIHVIDRTPINGSDNVRLSMRFSGGIQAGVIAETFYGLSA